MPTRGESLPLISLLALGGTIATAPSEGRMRPNLTADDLARSAAGLGTVARVESRSLRQLPSSDLTFADIAEVARDVAAAIAEGASGVVVTQGTDTLEETAFLLDVLLDEERPVVVTGAMRNPTMPGADGAANLGAAVRVAAARAAAGLGVLAVMNDEIHAARFVRKLHTARPSAFASPAAGPLGWVAEDRVRIAMRPAEPTLTLRWPGKAPEVPLVTLGFSMGPEAFAPHLATRPAGLVIESLGAGHVPSRTVQAIGELAAKVPVLLASRIGTGEVFRGTYGYDGSETDLLRRGCIPAGWLDAAKTRVLLALLLANGADRSAVADAFARY